MTIFVGYAKQAKSGWPYILTGVVIFFLLLIGLVLWVSFLSTPPKLETVSTSSTTFTSTTSSSLPSFEGTSSTLRKEGKEVVVEKIIIASALDKNNLPIDQLASISLEKIQTVYCYTRVGSSSLPQVIKHVWIDPEGKTFAEISLNLLRSPQDTWSYVSLLGTKKGRWEVQVRTEAGKELAKASFYVD